MTKRLREPLGGKGSVLVLSVLLFLSGGLRIATGTTEALAADNPMAAKDSEQADLPLVPEDRIAPSSPMEPEQVMTLVEALKIRENEINERERQAKVQAEALATARAEIDKKLAQLEAAEKKLRSTIALADEAAENDLARLTTVYENMKPKDAAALFEEMDPEFAAGFMGRMRPDAAANILAGLSPQIAYSISAILAGRNAEVPTR